MNRAHWTVVALLLVGMALASAHLAMSQTAVQVVECSGDVTSTVQQFVEASAGPGPSFLQFTPGECEITQTIKICNKWGMRIEGAGRGSTHLVWNPPSSDPPDEGPMFSVQNSAGIQFAHFDVYIKDNGPDLTYLVSAVDMYNSCHSCEVGGVDLCDPIVSGYYPLSDPHSHGNHFEDISIRAGSVRGVLFNGIRALLFGRRIDLQGVQDAVASSCTISPEGDDDDSTLTMSELAEDMYTNNPDRWSSFLRADCHNEQHSFANVHVSEFRDSAFVVEGRNSKGNVFENCTCDGRYAGDPEDYGDGCCGFSCLKTGQFEADNRRTPVVDDLTTSGSFHWYGGMARNISGNRSRRYLLTGDVGPAYRGA